MTVNSENSSEEINISPKAKKVSKSSGKKRKASESAKIYLSLCDDSGVISFESFDKWFTSYNKEKKRKLPGGDSTVQVLKKSRKNQILRAIKASLKKGIKAKKFYSGGTTHECAAETMMSKLEFNEIFGKIGTIDKEKKNTSKITSKYLTRADLVSVFDKMLDDLTTMTYSQPRFMRKQYQTGREALDFQNASINYSANTTKCKFKFCLSTDDSDVNVCFW